MAKLTATIAVSVLTLAFSVPAFAAETNTSGPDSAVTQSQDNSPATGVDQSDRTGSARSQSAQMPSASPGRVQEEKEQAAKNGQLGGSSDTPALEKPNNDAGSAQSSGPETSPPR